MPTDLQIVDGFEGLRSEFIDANPALRHAEPNGPGAASPLARHNAERVLEAWVYATLGLEQTDGRNRRRAQSLVREFRSSLKRSGKTAPSSDGAEAEFEDRPELLKAGRAVASALRERMDRRGEVGLGDRPLSVGEEAAQWAGMLPGLPKLKAWRLLVHLGRPVLVPEAQLRRFLWRVGLIDSEKLNSTGDEAAVAAAVERCRQLTGYGIGEINQIIQWHTRRVRGLSGGHRCGPVPDCVACPFAIGCAWNRYAGKSGPGEEDRVASRAEMAKVRRRWKDHGGADLDTSEVLALALQGGGGGANPIRTAEILIDRFHGIKGLSQASVAEIAAIEGVGPARASRIKLALELGRRILLQPLRSGAPITSSNEVWLGFRDRYLHITQEHFITLLFDTKNRFMHSFLVSKGSLNSSSAHPREVFKEAIQASASAIIIMHNHPSGDPEPSGEDIALTAQLADAGKILGIRVLDHIILGDDSYYSFKDSGRMP